MEREWIDKYLLKAQYRDWWSKLTDGVLAASILFLTWVSIILSIRPIEQGFGLPGLLVYVLGLLAVSMISLQQTLLYRHTEITRAWFGIAGGGLAWSVAVVCSYLGVPILPGPAGIITLIMGSLIVGLLWKSVLPVGVRFFCLMFILNWAEYSFITLLQRLAEFSLEFELIYRMTGLLAIVGAFLTLGWILFKSQRRIERLRGALILWFLVGLAMYVFYGPLF